MAPLPIICKELVIATDFLNLLVAVWAFVLLPGTIIFAVSAEAAASGDLCPRIGIKTTLKISPPAFPAAFVTIEVTLAL